MRAVTRPTAREQAPGSAGAPQPPCCPFYHEAIELIGRRWSGAIIAVLLAFEPLRFSDIATCVPEISDRLLAQRVKELEARGVIARTVDPGPPVRVRYTLTPMGRGLAPAIDELHAWAQRWLPGVAPGAGDAPRA